MSLTILLSASIETPFSIEAGQADGKQHFDHHGEMSENPSPCNDPRIVAAPDGSEVGITHMDADTFVGLLRLAGQPMPNVDLSIMEEIDNSGSAGVSKEDRTLHYMVGISQLSRLAKFPRCPKEGQIDVSAELAEMMTYSDEKIIAMGKEAVEASEATYTDCRKAVGSKVGLWSVGANNPFDPSRPYEDGFEIVVSYRRHHKAMSIYCSGVTSHAFADKTIAGVLFAGHPQACGSPHGEEITEEKALEVFRHIKKYYIK
jgi:hypothetical protein